MDAFITQVMSKLGLFGVVLLMFLENAFPPIPSEVIMTAAGFASTKGAFSFLGVVLAGTAGSVLGAMLLYYVGKVFDKDRLMWLTKRFGKYVLVTPNDVQKALDWFDKYGYAVVFFGRMIPAIRSLISIPAGMSNMPLVPFLALTAAGSALWTAFLAYMGVVLGANYSAIESYISPVSKIVVAVVLLGAIGFFCHRLLTQYRRR